MLQKAETGGGFTHEDIRCLLQAWPGEEEYGLFALADKFRQQHHGDEVHLRGIVEFANYCRNDCYYCGLRCSNKSMQRYRIPQEEILAAVDFAGQLGYRTIVLQGGEDPCYTGEDLAELISCVKKIGDFAVTVCVGERSREDYVLMKEAGADRYLMKHETSDPVLFSRLRPGTSLKKRLQRLQWLKELGYQVGSGIMVGLPGQTVETIAQDILLFKEIDIEMIGIGPFIPHGQTPLKDCLPGDLNLTLRVLAVTRLVLPWVHLPATTALGTLHPEGKQMALNCGANVNMPNLTPGKYREMYQIYPEKAGSKENAEQSHFKAISIIETVGRKISNGRGDGLKWLHGSSPVQGREV